jgi:hypothetical protein
MGLKDGITTEDKVMVSLGCAICGKAVSTGQSHQCEANNIQGDSEWRKEEKESRK